MEDLMLKISPCKCDKRHYVKCLVVMGNCYGFVKICHMKRDWPMMKSQGMENSQAQSCSPNLDVLRIITFMLSNPEVIKRSCRTW